MGLWLTTFPVVAFLVMPALYLKLTGTPVWQLPAAGQADFALWSEVAELLITALLLAGISLRHGSDELSARQLFNYSPARPLQQGRGWLVWTGVGLAAAPVLVGAVAVALTAVGYDSVVGSGRGTADGVAGMLSADVPTYLKLLAVAGVLAPLLEESLFRGFLLTSLSSIMPTWAAILASSTAFGIAHLSLRDLPVLTTLGCLLGCLYVRSRNLLTPMLVHGAWNSAVLSFLFWLAASGLDVEQLLRDSR